MDCKICSQEITLSELLLLPFAFRLTITRDFFRFVFKCPICSDCFKNVDWKKL